MKQYYDRIYHNISRYLKEEKMIFKFVICFIAGIGAGAWNRLCRHERRGGNQPNADYVFGDAGL